MERTARQLEPEPWSAGDAAAAVLGLIARNPTLVGGATAFLVALSFVSANALWYQPHAHSGAFFATRDLLRPGAEPAMPDETTILIERPQPPPPVGDPTVKRVQATLRDLNFYSGEVDGLYGPNTRTAIEAYQAKMGMAVTGTVDDSLLDNLGTGSVVPAVLPSPAPRAQATRVASGTAEADARPAAPARDERIAKVQAGLREFGNEAIDVDGLMGTRTAAGIREFQSLFGLPETGEVDNAVYAKMKEIGLIE
ncbi:peptidoglycan-binding domain-containing protein [Mesorhizobium marinum]|uniref:Peptidoglycan-binding protein n=1 Tax=Mesorhizobium marinum TaxID=3228790 RepID=A0ABV3R1B6_9HYPH